MAYQHPYPQPYQGQAPPPPQPYPAAANYYPGYGPMSQHQTPQPHMTPQPHPYQMYQQESQHYGRYGQYYSDSVFKLSAWEAYKFRQPDDLQAVFIQEMTKNPENVARQALQSEDLMNVLNNTPSIRNFYRINWSKEMCSIMMAMLDRSQDGFMQWNEFLELQQCLVAWHKVFCQYDYDHSGYIDSKELFFVIGHLFGYRIRAETLETILKRYSRVVPPNAKCIIAFDDFVALCVRLRAYTDAFRKRDSRDHGHETGSCQFGYDDFLQCVLCL